MSDQAPNGDDDLLRESQQSIDEAKAAAADVVEPEEEDLVDEGIPAADGPAAGDDPAPAA
ncbi:hypothetical protein [Curtobacterium sp. 9128]|uniref:hypothetical protein n=1 Tax=Curtobacterium sp. 9128 TaxID=1793722 RepID=UPI0011A00EF2|nr:hypothetical protein [Curtobacterium sp. 9128]